MAKGNVRFGGELVPTGYEPLAKEGTRCALNQFLEGFLVVRHAWVDVFVALC